MSRPLSVIILAAGQGTRMRSALPKVLHPVGPSPMLGHVVDAAAALAPAGIHVVHGHGGEAVREAFRDRPITWVEQPEQLGTGHAVGCALPGIPDDHTALVLYGDVPLVTPATLERLAGAAEQRLAILTTQLAHPAGYGRILRDDRGAVVGVVEEKDATETQRAIGEVNTGMLAGPAGELRRWLAGTSRDNAQGEYYLTDVVALAAGEGNPAVAVVTHDPDEAAGVNNRVQLAAAETAYRRRRAEALMLAGVTLRDPARVDIRGEVETPGDVEIDVDVVLEGRVTLGRDIYIGPGAVLRDCRLGDGVRVEAHTVVEGGSLGAGSSVGPFARIRPGSELAEGAKVGNFVETKASRIGAGSKVNHLAYIGDTEMGAGVNVGAGTITCNYDGARKHTTTIGDDAFIGSDCQLVAPVTVGSGATLGAGTTLTRDAPAGQLTITRVRQRTIEDWRRPCKDDDSEG
ncbi:MAG: bifunctional UDP-N-acetylglucosamine diphosphorylase/glucosamine-1-phosphate N-acetyltransferase GlmU [Thiohalospira sp.]